MRDVLAWTGVLALGYLVYQYIWLPTRQERRAKSDSVRDLSAATFDNVRYLLESLKLQHHMDKFIIHEIDDELLAVVTDDMLAEAQIPVGARMRILKRLEDVNRDPQGSLVARGASFRASMRRSGGAGPRPASTGSTGSTGSSQRRRSVSSTGSAMLKAKAAMPSVCEDCDCGAKESLAESVSLYHRQVFVATGRSDWARKVEEEESFAGDVARAVAALKQSSPTATGSTASLITVPETQAVVRVTACDMPVSSEADAGPEEASLLVFPERRLYTKVARGDIQVWVDAVLRGDTTTASYAPNWTVSKVPSNHMMVFVCTHNSRDVNCGTKGPAVVAALKEEVKTRGLSHTISVHACSHIGGHKYAGNVIVYPRGDWYGYITPALVPQLLACLLRGDVLASHLRGSIQPRT